MRQIARYVPLSVRVLFRRPFRTAVTIGFLGGCLALNFAIFAVVDGSLFKPLPFPGADRLVSIGLDLRTTGVTRPGPLSRRHVRDLQDAPALEGIAAWTSGAMAADRSGDDSLRSVGVTAGFFELLGARPIVGRPLQAEDRVAASVVPVVISDTLWRARLAADPGVIGTHVALGGLRCLVVGVAPRGFDVPLGANVWNLAELDARASEEIPTLAAFARLRPGAACPAEAGGSRLVCEPLRRTFNPRNASSLALVLVAATALMAMTWFQIACLELARTLTRMRELGVRIALGATRGTLALESVAQGAAVGLGALAAGAMLLRPLLSWLVGLLPAELTIGRPIAADGRALLFAAVLAIGITASFAILPLQALSRADTTRLLRDVVGGSKVTAPWIILIGQVALSTALLYVAGLTVHSLLAVSRVDLGYSTSGIVVARLPDGRVAGAGRIAYEQFADRLRERRSVVALAGSDGRPLGGPTTIVSVGRPGERQGIRARMVCVTPGYFRTLGVPLLGGRDFSASDVRGSGFVLIVNRALARRLGLAGWVEGQRLTLLGFPAGLVGVVGDAILTRPDDPDQEVAFVPTAQWAPPTYLLVRARTGTGGQQQAMTDVSGVLRQFAVPGSFSVLALEDEARRSTAVYRARTVLLLAIGVIGLALCVAGVFGAVSYAWTQVRRSVAVRLALGGTPTAIRAYLLGAVALRTAVGLGVGTGAGVLAGKSGSAFLFGVPPIDGVSVVAAALAVGGACLCAALPPTIRVGRVQPSVVLREE